MNIVSVRQFLVVVCLLHFSLASGQTFVYPKIVGYGKTMTDFIPNNWTVLGSAKGDLNHDQMNDFALVIQFRDSVWVSNTENDYSDTVKAQPRILMIAFYDEETKQYKLIEQSNTFILLHDNPAMDEPFQDMSVSHDILEINFQIFMNMGSWEMSSLSYKFQYKNREFILIGADNNSTNRASGETEDLSYNFLSRQVKISTGNISIDKQKTKWRRLQMEKSKTLKTFNQPLTWEVEKGLFL
jgi:hypothetical protein